MRVWTDGNDSVKPTCAKVAADLAQRLEAASGLVDANIHISRKTIEDNVRGDKFEKLENDFLEKLKYVAVIPLSYPCHKQTLTWK